MKDSKLLGIQDTLELFTGRQYFENVFISGYTDFIFGTNNTTYFKNCTVHVVDTGKDDSGTAGYLTAFKGSNKGSGDAIKYGAIFDDCDFTADEGVMEGKTAIGRTWGAYAAVAVINSNLGKHISKDGYVSSENKNKRYISMNGVHPTDETVQFVEYNNTGEGAISEAVAGCKFLTAEEAANYSNFEVIFGTTNGKVTYKKAWDPFSTVIEETKDWELDLSATGVNIQKTTGEYENLRIDATNGKFADNTTGWVQVNAGTIIEFDVEAHAKIILSAYSSADNFTIAVEEGVAIITCTGNDYLNKISVTYPEIYDVTSTIDLSATGANIQKTTGAYEGLEIDATNGKFADNTTGWVQVNAGTIIRLHVVEGATVSVSAYSSADNFTIAVEEGVATIVCNVNDYLNAITVTVPVVYKETTTIDLSATGANIQKTTGAYEGLEIDATNGKFADNNGGWVQVNAGTIIRLNVAEGATVSVSAYSSADNFTIAVEEGVATITCTANDYLSAINVAY